jgi:CRISPR/Cas system-associated exonuclease Cas4 (RecB family)
LIALPQLQPASNGKLLTPNDIAMAMTGRPHQSHSETRTYLSCKLKWYYTYCEKAKPERVSAALLLGIGIHTSIELHFQRIMASEPKPSMDEMLKVFDAGWEEQAQDIPVIYSRGQDRASIRKLVADMLKVFQASEHAEPVGQIIGLEESFKTKLHPNLPDLAGRVDMITYDEAANELLITDFKTSRSVWGPGQAQDQATQLMLYAEGCGEIARDLGATLALQFIVITKTKQPKIEAIRIELDPAKVERSRQTLLAVFQAMQTGIIYPAPDPMSCSSCGYRERCKKWPK